MLQDYLPAPAAAKYLRLARTYLDYLRGADAKKRGLSGPHFITHHGRILYHTADLDHWNADRLARKSRASNQ